MDVRSTVNKALCKIYKRSEVATIQNVTVPSVFSFFCSCGSRGSSFVVIANGPLVPVTVPELFRWKLGEVMFRRFQTTVPMWIY